MKPPHETLFPYFRLSSAVAPSPHCHPSFELQIVFLCSLTLSISSVLLSDSSALLSVSKSVTPREIPHSRKLPSTS
ncbi:hypothetical protein LINPERPRIM_LOCUS22013 [Linum perenne]